MLEREPKVIVAIFQGFHVYFVLDWARRILPGRHFWPISTGQSPPLKVKRSQQTAEVIPGTKRCTF